jgi:hypothetical protein
MTYFCQKEEDNDLFCLKIGFYINPIKLIYLLLIIYNYWSGSDIILKLDIKLNLTLQYRL